MNDQIWNQRGNTFHAGNIANTAETLPPGLYKTVMTPQGWYLERTQDRFTFPYKIYGLNSSIITRVAKAWDNLEGSLGILLNGLKGTGKTVTAQILANWAIDKGYPVILIDNIFPVDELVKTIQQDSIFMFDEFEKTHPKHEHQQGLLSVIDGMGRSKFKRMWLFTTNIKKLEDNFINRPSRIRYNWEFDRLTEEIVNELMDDILHKNLWNFRADIQQYLYTRRVLSIDVAKTVINEVNIFQEAPTVFENIMNLEKLSPNSWNVDITDSKGNVIDNIDSYYRPNKDTQEILLSFQTAAGQETFRENWLDKGHQYLVMVAGTRIYIEDIHPEAKLPVATLHIPVDKTWINKFPKITRNYSGYRLAIQTQPKDWQPPECFDKFEKMTLTEENTEAYEKLEMDVADFFSAGKLYLPGIEPTKIFVKFSPNYYQYTQTASPY